MCRRRDTRLRPATIAADRERERHRRVVAALLAQIAIEVDACADRVAAAFRSSSRPIVNAETAKRIASARAAVHRGGPRGAASSPMCIRPFRNVAGRDDDARRSERGSPSSNASPETRPPLGRRSRPPLQQTSDVRLALRASRAPSAVALLVRLGAWRPHRRARGCGSAA